MEIARIRSAIRRLVIVGALAIAVVIGSMAVNHPSEANAMPKLTCAQATQVGDTWTVYGNLMAAYGYTGQAAHAYAVADAYYDICNSWA